MNISILGAGAWGSALAISLAARHRVVVWGRNPQGMQQALQTRQLHGFTLPAHLTLTSDFNAATSHVDCPDGLLIIATSVSGLRPVAQALKPLMSRYHAETVAEAGPIQALSLRAPDLIWLCKGLEQDSLLLPHQVILEVLGDQVACGALSGPSFALEVAEGKPCALTIATHSAGLAQRVVGAVHGPEIRVYSSDDLVGVEVGGAIKNIMAIATGIADGLGLGLNARAALITRGLAEITRLGLALGGQLETFMGLTGMGDLILTCTGDLSRNRRVGLALAKGTALAQIIQDLGHVAEGVRCAQAVRTLSRQLGVSMPITEAVAGVLFDGDGTADMVKRLLARESRAETH